MISDGAVVGIGLARLWHPEAVIKPGPKPRISLDSIVAVALDLARREGIQAVSMPRIAVALGCSKMALYRHVSDKEDLVSVMLDAALAAPPPLDDTEAGWRDRVSVLWRHLLAVYTRDVWITDLPAGVTGFTPNNLRWIEAALTVLSASTLSGEQQLSVALYLTSMAKWHASRAATTLGSADEFDLLLGVPAGTFFSAAPAESFPALTAVVNESRRRPVTQAESDSFVLGLVLNTIDRYF